MTTFDFAKETDILNGINSAYDELMKYYTETIEKSLAVLLEENYIIVGDPAVSYYLKTVAPDKANYIVYSEFVSNDVVLVVKKIAISSENFMEVMQK